MGQPAPPRASGGAIVTRREFGLLLAAAWNEQSRAIIRALYARPRRGERDRAKLAPPKHRKFAEKARVWRQKTG